MQNTCLKLKHIFKHILEGNIALLNQWDLRWLLFFAIFHYLETVYGICKENIYKNNFNKIFFWIIKLDTMHFLDRHERHRGALMGWNPLSNSRLTSSHQDRKFRLIGFQDSIKTLAVRKKGWYRGIVVTACFVSLVGGFVFFFSLN